MEQRRWAWALLTFAGLGSVAVAACVGDDATGVSAPDADGGGGSDTGSDTSMISISTDAGADSASADSAPPPPKVDCNLAQPILFVPKQGEGTFCKGANTDDHCLFGERCCRDLAQNTQHCSTTTCGATEASIGCANSAECGDAGLVCCGTGDVRTDTCTYAVVEKFTTSTCRPSCTGLFQLCYVNDCTAGKVCTPARALTPDGTAVTNAVLSACK